MKNIVRIICILSPLLLTAQVKSIGLPNIKNYKKVDYMGGTQNWGIDQDKNDNLYFANSDGLLQFDGTIWRKYTIPDYSTARCVKVDDNTGRIFVGGYRGFGYFESDTNGELTYISLTKLLQKDDIDTLDFIWKIHINKDEIIFQSFEKAYIFKENNNIKLLEAPNRFQFSFQINERVYFQDAKAGMMEYKNGELHSMKGTPFFNQTEVWEMFAMPDEKLLFATLDKGLFLYDNEKVIPWDTEANSFILSNNSLGGVRINEDLLVLNSVLGGIIICNLQGDIIQHIDLDKGLQNNTVLSSFIDNKNNLWLGLDNGITFVHENSPFTYFRASEGINAVYGSVMHKDYLYVATNQGVFCRPKNDSFKNRVFTLVKGTATQCWNIQVVGGQLLCANNRGALLIENNKTINILDNKGYFGFKSIPGYPDYIIGSNYNGFAIFEKTIHGLVYKNQIDGFDKSSNSFELDDTHLWLKKDDLIYQMSWSDDFKEFNSIKKIPQITNDVHGINSLQKIRETVYFQSKNSFFKYSKEKDLFYKDEKMSSLFQETPIINSLLEDSQGNLWYTYDTSLSVFMKNKIGEYKNVVAPFSNLSKNLIPGYLSVNTIDSKNIFIGLADGLAHYDSEFSTDIITNPKIFIRSFSFSENTFIQGNPQEKLREYKIPYDSNHLKFSFSSPTYENLKNVEYSYRLDPFDSIWSNWSVNAMKEYTNLREGIYTMKVKVRNSYGMQSEEATIDFIISPPWHRHYIAYISYALLLLIGFYSTQRGIKHKIQKNKYYETIEQRKIYLEKESKIKQEQYELEKEIEKLKRDKLQIKILAKDKELVNNSIQVAKKNKVLKGIIHMLKDIDENRLDDHTKFQFNKLQKNITREVTTDNRWKDLEKHIKNVHFDFLKRLKEKHPTVSPRELDLCTYLLLNMSTKEIAEVMNISKGGVELARYRLRKKFKLHKKENLTGFLMSI
ncbi:triple tyrosine motif-containing protein [Aquimarina sp. RZ0]|uniref:triple tyrosine motif-containing protein n=1 Tax=Aquimarina sp. RZ0 TaxID=2607730 RepID=UPI0011F21130|nr:triple tyrosine motif-containing protein [Aquimarina sp. RZ0]KAA1245823.1 regulator [Aquimarina sp. RZ0]